MARIKLTNSTKTAGVDDDMADYINQWEWFLVTDNNGMHHAAREGRTEEHGETLILMEEVVWAESARRKKIKEDEEKNK